MNAITTNTPELITSIDHTGKVCKLVHASTGLPVHVGETVTSLKGNASRIQGGTAPRHSASSGHVHIGDFQSLYASVYGLVWVPVPMRPVWPRATECLMDIARTIGGHRLCREGDSRDDFEDFCEWALEFQVLYESKLDAGETYYEDSEAFSLRKATEAGFEVFIPDTSL